MYFRFNKKCNRIKKISHLVPFIIIILVVFNIFGNQNIGAKQLEQKAYKLEKHYTKYNNKLKEENCGDKNYYDSICDNCKNHPEKIEQNIREGGDEKWWNYMCTDFCKDYAKWNVYNEY